jgi:two-component system, chemotaxis family, chemotaxis protein CheY
VKKTILCVCDSASMRLLLAHALRDERYNIITSPDGNKSLARVETTQVDLVLTDLIQPGTDGIEFTRNFRAKQRYKFTPVLIMTAGSQDSRKDEGEKAGVSGWIAKPFTAEKLKTIVKQFVC